MNSALVTTMAIPNSSVAMATRIEYGSGLGKLGTLVGRASETICASIGTARRSAVMRLASKRACRRSSSARLDLATASSWRS